MAKIDRTRRPQRRFGIGEWYGSLFTNLSLDQRREYSRASLARCSNGIEETPLSCPFLPASACNKRSGACTFRLYERAQGTDDARAVGGLEGRLRTFCPRRFEERGIIYEWVAREILQCRKPTVLKEVPFLESPGREADDRGINVGRIDRVILNSNKAPFRWCALEFQAVYFSGKGMTTEFRQIENHDGDTIPFPVYPRRPDWRSSGPKRLMPQLQIKIPTLRRWGKKMAVVIDDGFFSAMAPMRDVKHISNCDVAWFVVRYEEREGRAQLVPDTIRLTTLEDSVEGLTAGLAVSMDIFEQRILARLQGLSNPR